MSGELGMKGTQQDLALARDRVTVDVRKHLTIDAIALDFHGAEGIEKLFRSLGVDSPAPIALVRDEVDRRLVGRLVSGSPSPVLSGDPCTVPDLAVREERAAARTVPPLHPWVAGLVVVGSLLLLARAMLSDELGTGIRLLSIAGGVLLLFLGVAMLSSKLVAPIATVVGSAPRSAGGAAGRLAS